MTPESIFKICNAIAMIGWLILIIASPLWFHFDRFVLGVIITLLSIVYAWLLSQSFSPQDIVKFDNLDGVMELFQNRTLVTAGWVHYLAFDLMLGIWIKRNSVKYGITHWLVIPCLFLTFMLGPIGLLLYLVVRIFYTRRYFADNF